MSKVIFLNGCASSGKTTLAKEIQNLSKEKYLYIPIDTLFGAVPEKIVGFDQKTKEGFRYVVDPKTDRLTEMKVSPWTGKVFSCLPKIVKLLADNGLNVIFCECNFVQKNDTTPLIDDYKVLFSDHEFYMINVRIRNLETLEQREKSRGDRVMGMAKLFYQNEEDFNYTYDLVVYNDTPESPSLNAKKILELINESKMSRQIPNKLPDFVRVVIQNEKGELLVIFEKKWNCWVFPGGKIEPSETPLQAAKREIFEETNLIIEDLEIVAEQTFSAKNVKNQQCIGYLVKANKYSEETKIKEPEKISDIKFKRIDYEFAINRLFYAISFEIK